MRKLSRIFVCAFAAAALMSCSKEQNGDPFMLFEVYGKVIDADGNPLQGINVLSGSPGVQVTNPDGSFSFYGRSVPSDSILLTFEDKDGQDNGGEFVKLTKEIFLKEKTPGFDTGNYRGTFFAGGVEVIMVSTNMGLNPDSGLIPLGNGN